ncbi:MAG: hypothetical protein M0Q91_13995 [Methanoregula sp.]|jgi:hypothetical protein|nr:hypothetical protein [Methanoregula sp.]
MELEFRVTGIVRVRETGQPLSGLIVRAYDKDLLYDDLLGDTTTDAGGRFDVRYAGSDFRELFERHSDMYFKILDASGKRVIHSTADSIRWNAGTEEYIEIEISQHQILLSDEHETELVDAQGTRRTDFEVGESLLLTLKGLRPCHSHLVRLLDDADHEILNVSLITDRYGVIEPTVVWPDLGIGDPKVNGRFAYETYEQAMNAIAGRSFLLEVLDDGHVIRKSKFRVVGEMSRPRLYSSSDSGRLRRGLLLGHDEVRVQGRYFPQGSLVDVYLVQRQYDWRSGDPIVPVRNSDGSEVVKRVRLEGGDSNFNILLWPRELVRAGSYDIIARVVLPHEFRAGTRILRATDIVSDRLMTSVVVRDDIFRYKPILQGCVMAMKEIAGKKLSGSPYFEFTNNFPKGTDVWAALDPAGLMPDAVGKKIRYYVVSHKTPSQWSADSGLTDVTGQVSTTITTSSCINGNAMCVWPDPQQAGKYDLVVDFGNNAPDPVNFVENHSFDPPLDMIDGYLNVGFYVTDDPSMPGSFAVGQTSFDGGAVDIDAIGVWSPYGPDPLGATPSGTLSLPRIAEVRYPADVNGVDVPVSLAETNYPVVVVMHGMHTTADPSYLGYNYLLDHLASHGFIAVSIDCNVINAIVGMQDTRGHAILKHLELLQDKNTVPGLFQNKIDMSRIGIMGHSRGGDGVVQAEIFNQSLGAGWNIKAIVALAPTDFSGTSLTPLNLATSKFLCIYGSNDGDVWGGSNPSTAYTGTGFRFYDRATIEKAMVFIYGATHNRFNTQWGTEWKVDASSPKVLSEDQHHFLLNGYMTAFMQAHLQDRTEQLDYFNGELRIPQVASVDVHTQYRPSSQCLTLDNFESVPALNQNSLGGIVTYTNLDGQPQEDPLGVIDPNSPHQTRGIRIKWNVSSATYQSEIPPVGSERNISGFNFMSLRISQKVGSPANPVDQLQDLSVRLTTANGGNSRAVRVGYFGTIPFPYKPEYITSKDSDEGPNTKAALKTIRIPLHAWTIKALTAPIVDLTNIESIAFEFNSKPMGEVEIDDIEFTN